MKEKESYAIELETSMYAFLQEMTEEFSLSDVDKAVRCLVNYARDEADKRESIFQEIRCLDC